MVTSVFNSLSNFKAVQFVFPVNGLASKKENQIQIECKIYGCPLNPSMLGRCIVLELRKSLLGLYEAHRYFIVWLKDELFPMKSTLSDLLKLKPKRVSLSSSTRPWMASRASRWRHWAVAMLSSRSL